MNSILKNNKPVIKFLAIFIISYAILYLLYYWFINNNNTIDFYTEIVSNQTIKSLNFIGYETYAVTNKTNDFINLFVRGKNIAGIAEGCNAASVMILFLAFIFSFSKGIKKTSIFALLGIGIIHIMNIIRIVTIIVCIYHFPDYTTPIHDYIFPSIIYGVVFLLWMYWVNSFQKVNNE